MSTQIEPRPEFAGILRTQETFGTGEGRDFNDRLNSSFDKILLQSGLDISPSTLLMLVLLGGVTLGGIAYVIQENFLTTAVGFMAGMLLPLLIILFVRNQRQSKMMSQLPEMVDELGRAARTGRSIDQCFRLVAEDTPAPLGDELRLCSSKLDLGINLRQALDGLPERTGLVSLNILTMALGVHMVTGGDLVAVLERLSRTLRERIHYLGRLRAATSASRATAILMIALPPAILAFFLFRDPGYFTNLMASGWGRAITLTAIALDIIGVIWVLRILNRSAQT